MFCARRWDLLSVLGDDALLLGLLLRLLVGLLVLGQMIASHELLVAHIASEPFLSSVRSIVSLQFIGSSKFLAAIIPATAKRFLAGVPSQMGLEVAGLVVGFSTTGNVADV